MNDDQKCKCKYWEGKENGGYILMVCKECGRSFIVKAPETGEK